MIQNGSSEDGRTGGRFVQQGAFAPEEKEKRAVVETAEKQSVKDLDAVRAFIGKIKSEEDYHRVAQILVGVKNGLNEWLALMDPVREAQYRAWKTTCATINKVADPWKQAQDIAISELGKWEVVRAERHRAEQEEANAALRKEAEDHVINQAVALVEQDRPEVAEQLLAQGPVIAPAIVPRPEKADGLTTVKRWVAKVTDPLTLIKEIAAGRQPIAFVELNMAALNMQAKSLKAELRIPGVEAVEEISYARKAR